VEAARDNVAAMLEIGSVRERVRQSLWFIPGLFAVGAGALALGLLAIDQELSGEGGGFFQFGGTAEGARSVLSTIAQSMLTFTGLVFTITMLVLQLASSQLSPRVMRTFLRDRSNQVVLGLFVATFLYTLLVLRDVRTPVGDEAGFVPGLSIWVAFLLLVASVAAFVYYIDHMAHAIRASTVIDNIATETREAIDRLFPDPASSQPDDGPVEGVADLGQPDAVLGSDRPGVLVAVDESELLAATSAPDRCAELIPVLGDYVPEDAPLYRTWGRWDRAAEDRLRAAVELGRERTMQQDPAFGFRQLVDVAARALSPGTNDPTTAVQALDRLHDLLRRLATREFPPAVRLRGDGSVRARLPRPGWDDYVRLAVEEVRVYGKGHVQVVRRLRALLHDLESVVPEERQAILRHELQRLDDLPALDRGQ